MKSHRFLAIASPLLILSLISAACASATATPTSTSTAPPPTSTVPPTATLVPSPTPDIAATQQADAFNALLNKFMQAGYLDTTTGDIQALSPTETNWKTGSWSPNDASNPPTEFSDFLLSGHFAWDPVKGNPQSIGCMIVFGLQSGSTPDQYLLQYSKSSISLAWLTQPSASKFPLMYEIGKASGTGRVDFSTKTETDFAALLRGLSLYVSFDGAVTKYSLAANRPTKGVLVLIRDASSQSCTMTNLMLWTPK